MPLLIAPVFLSSHLHFIFTYFQTLLIAPRYVLFLHPPCIFIIIHFPFFIFILFLAPLLYTCFFFFFFFFLKIFKNHKNSKK